jgi:hypothetical protein
MQTVNIPKVQSVPCDHLFHAESMLVIQSNLQFLPITVASSVLFCGAMLVPSSLNQILHWGMSFLSVSLLISVVLAIFIPATFERDKSYKHIPGAFNAMGQLCFTSFLLGTCLLCVAVLPLGTTSMLPFLAGAYIGFRSLEFKFADH